MLRAAALGAAAAAAAACGAKGPADRATPPTATPTRPTPVPGHPAGSGSAGAAGPTAALPAGLPFEVAAGPADRGRVALTFHGQGDPAIARAVLDEAAAGGARITVLAVGTWLDEQPQVARLILDGGHELGNHTLNHRAISGMSADAAYAEIAGCAERLQRLTGSPGRWFRPSQAQDCTARVADQARRAGYQHCLGYNLDSLDYTDPGPAAVQQTVLGRVGPGSIVSLHLGHQGTVAALPGILEGLQARSLQAVTATELFS
ncbi:polysaccharide deacetylase family protein [Kitasatospora paranensis]